MEKNGFESPDVVSYAIFGCRRRGDETLTWPWFFRFFGFGDGKNGFESPHVVSYGILVVGDEVTRL